MYLSFHVVFSCEPFYLDVALGYLGNEKSLLHFAMEYEQRLLMVICYESDSILFSPLRPYLLT